MYLNQLILTIAGDWFATLPSGNTSDGSTPWGLIALYSSVNWIRFNEPVGHWWARLERCRMGCSWDGEWFGCARMRMSASTSTAYFISLEYRFRSCIVLNSLFISIEFGIEEAPTKGKRQTRAFSWPWTNDDRPAIVRQRRRVRGFPALRLGRSHAGAVGGLVGGWRRSPGFQRAAGGTDHQGERCTANEVLINIMELECWFSVFLIHLAAAHEVYLGDLYYICKR